MTTIDPPQRRRLLIHFAVAAGALLLGAVASTGVLILSGWRYQPEREFAVTVFMERDATEQQKSAVRAVLDRIPSDNGVEVESKEEAFARFQELYRDRPDFTESVEAKDMPESFKVTSRARSFDCVQVRPLTNLGGVDEYNVIMTPTKARTGSRLGC